MSYELLTAAAARADDLGPVVEMRITVELRRWQAAEAVGLLEAGQEEAATAALAGHALGAHPAAADGKAWLWAGTITVVHQDITQWRTDSTVIDTAGPVIDLVHPARSKDELAMHVAGVGNTEQAPLGEGDRPSRWMAAFTREAVPCCPSPNSSNSCS